MGYLRIMILANAAALMWGAAYYYAATSTSHLTVSIMILAGVSLSFATLVAIKKY